MGDDHDLEGESSAVDFDRVAYLAARPVFSWGESGWALCACLEVEEALGLADGFGGSSWLRAVVRGVSLRLRHGADADDRALAFAWALGRLGERDMRRRTAGLGLARHFLRWGSEEEAIRMAWEMAGSRRRWVQHAGVSSMNEHWRDIFVPALGRVWENGATRNLAWVVTRRMGPEWLRERADEVWGKMTPGRRAVLLSRILPARVDLVDRLAEESSRAMVKLDALTGWTSSVGRAFAAVAESDDERESPLTSGGATLYWLARQRNWAALTSLTSVYGGVVLDLRAYLSGAGHSLGDEEANDETDPFSEDWE